MLDSLFEHLLHVFDLLPGELLELRVGVLDLHAGLDVLSHPLVQLSAPLQFSAQLRVGAPRGGLLRRLLVLLDHPVHGHRFFNSLLDLESTVQL